MKGQYMSNTRYSEMNLPQRGNQVSLYAPGTSHGINGENAHKYFSEFGDQAAEMEMQSLQSHGLKSVSGKKLKPLFTEKKAAMERKSRKMTQSLLFNQGLTFVLRKGKVVPTEKYVSSYMMPYTSMDYQSVQLRSNVNRHAIHLQQLEPVPVKTNLPSSTKSKNSKKKSSTSRARKAQTGKNKSLNPDGTRKSIIEEESQDGASDQD